jgi:hypothetical protein
MSKALLQLAEKVATVGGCIVGASFILFPLAYWLMDLREYLFSKEPKVKPQDRPDSAFYMPRKRDERRVLPLVFIFSGYGVLVVGLFTLALAIAVIELLLQWLK